MSAVLPYLSAILLLATTTLGWGLTLVGLPGNWLMVLAAVVYAMFGPTEGAMQVAFSTAVATAVLAGIGELAELAASAWGARRAGGSRRAAVFALFGSLVGAIGGALVGLPIPIVGSAVAAVVGGALGALAGAALAERSRGETQSKSWQVGQAAFWGRLLGTGIKTVFATVIAGMIAVALVV